MSVPLILLISVIVGALVGAVVGSLLGWCGAGPFNWRVFLGPDAYYRWLDSRGEVSQ